jgi:hypothetical protein
VIRKIDGPGNSYLAFEAAGTVDADDVREFQSELGRAANDDAPVRVLVDIVGLKSAELGAVWQDMKGVAAYSRLIDRLAVVGDARWERWLATAASLMPGLEARYFEAHQRAEAVLWLNG